MAKVDGNSEETVSSEAVSEENGVDEASEENTENEESTEAPEEETSEEILLLESRVLELEKECDTLKASNEKLEKDLLLTVADTENYKKRLGREQEDLIKFAHESFFKDLIVTMDHFDKALEASAKASNMDAILEGVKLIYGEIKETMKKNGVKDIDSVGKEFDPNLHEAIAKVPSEEHKEDNIVEEFRKGYFLNDRVLRASMVTVSTGKPQPKTEEEDKNNK